MCACDPQNLLSTVVCNLVLTLCMLRCYDTAKVGIPLRLEYQLMHIAALLYIVKGQQAPG